METRNIYFVRHGETDANVAGVAQSSDSQLTEQGKVQAKIVANRLQQEKISAVFTSQFARAADTGEQIALSQNIKVVKLEVLNERKKPLSVFGLRHEDEKYLDFLTNFIDKASDIDYRYEDGENFYDLVQRVKKLLGYIENETSGNVAVVTHGIFLRILIAYILTKSDDMMVYVEAFKNIQVDNTGITHVKLSGKHWKLGTVNDSTHLS